jgi:putative nucleotidyltransferase with HDIG domain
MPIYEYLHLNAGMSEMNVIGLDDLVRKVGDLKVLPFVARKLLETLGDENSTIDDLSTIIEKDQTIAARVLKISNSALYGLRHEVTSIHQAVLVLGFKTIRSVVLSASTRALYKNFGMKEKIIWDHSIGAGIAARIISENSGSDVQEMAFVGGLMHDLGKVVMNNETPEVFGEVLMNIYNEGTGSIEAEESVFGYNHARVGSLVAEKWGFPETLVNVIANHHLNVFGTKSSEESAEDDILACVHLADNVCKYLGIGYRSPDENVDLAGLSSAVRLRIAENNLVEMIERIKTTYDSEKSVFD